jgi:hypothetical protein
MKNMYIAVLTNKDGVWEISLVKKNGALVRDTKIVMETCATEVLAISLGRSIAKAMEEMGGRVAVITYEGPVTDAKPLVEEDTPKFCVNCVHYYLDKGPASTTGTICNKARDLAYKNMPFDLVKGIQQPPDRMSYTCDNSRRHALNSSDYCGPRGLWFERKDG